MSKIQNFMMLVLTSQASYHLGEEGTTCADVSLDVVATMEDCQTAHTALGIDYGSLNARANGQLPFDTAPVGGYFWTGDITNIQAGCSSRQPLQYTQFGPASLHFNRNLDTNRHRYDLRPICVDLEPVVVDPPTVVPVSRVCIATPDEACRGTCATCNGNYAVTTGVATVEQCQELCFAELLCTGYEYAPNKQNGRCEVWESPIQFTATVTGYTCHVCQDVDDTDVDDTPTDVDDTPTDVDDTPTDVDDTPTTPDALDCVETPDRACRGTCADCNGDYDLSTGVTVEQCKELCFAEPLCTGYEYAPSKLSGYCEVWKSPIQFTAAVPGYTCNVCSAPSRRLSSRFQALAKQIKN